MTTKTTTPSKRGESSAKFDGYEVTTQAILDSLNRGVIPWKRPWSQCDASPRSWDGHLYRGANWLLLTAMSAQMGWENPVFVTFKKALDLGGNVRKGEKGTKVVLWKFGKNKDEATGKEKGFAWMTSFTVFNVAQCDKLPALPPVQSYNFQPIEKAEETVSNMPSPPKIDHTGAGRNFYRPSSDSVHMTKSTAFHTAENYYAVLFHELGHSTGHTSRLDRDLSGNFGSQSYTREELVAEMTSAFLCAHCRIDSPTLENAAAYIANWKSVLASDPKAFMWAAGRAQRATDYILDQQFTGNE